ncbi:type IV toxin-antitoxin system AbiEi family antitoxin [Hymenobacter sp. UV11]|uniref:type IV toxin-antitoxin system AbiEi family antitoxin n=1 Tax=Hymenobacter sp. UV11 TaxID=1849735 RepID=UPI0010DA292C|nr:type IV toxin-antitoxin system AbiEi family antitoxin [Hymenobacter sp. UV11]TDN38867.1 hypothetical protein A8B98_22155 [Hymenobacter sp. UV11]
MLATFSSSAALLEQVRQRLQCSLAIPVWPQLAGPAETQVWHIGSEVRLLATPPARVSALTAPTRPALTGTYPTLLVFDYVSSRLGAQLRAQGQYYADAAGNAWLQHPGLLLSVQGCARPKAPVPATPVTPAGHVHLLRLLFQLLLEPALATYSPTNLAARTQLPLARVGAALRSLAKLDWWQAAALPPASPLPQPAATQHWLSHYARVLRCRLNPHRYRPRDPAALAGWPQRALPPECLWSGENAAHLLLSRSEPPTSLTLYSQMPRSQLVQQLDLVPYAQGTIEILNSFAPAACFASADPRCVPALLVYTDLLASRKPHCETLAHEMHARYLGSLVGVVD